MANLRFENLVKSYGNEAIVRGISCSIQHGEFIVIVGPSGCGKSTVLRMIAGLEPVTSGRLFIDDKDETATAAEQRGIAMVFQSYALYPHMSVRENMSFGLKNLKQSRAEITSKVEAAAQLLQLGALLDRLPHQLSGGQRQRVAIGRAIVREPKIFLLDEPLSNLDAELRVQMRRELGKLHKRLGSTMIYVTHDQTEAMTLADRVILLNQGQIAQVGTPLEIYNQPHDTFVAGFIGSPRINLVEAEVSSVTPSKLVLQSPLGRDLCLASSRLPGAEVGNKVTLGMRPEHLALHQRSSDLEVEFTVSVAESVGDSTCVYGSLANDAEFALKLQGQCEIQSGVSMAAYIAPEHVLLFDEQGRLMVSAGTGFRASAS